MKLFFLFYSTLPVSTVLQSSFKGNLIIKTYTHSDTFNAQLRGLKIITEPNKSFVTEDTRRDYDYGWQACVDHPRFRFGSVSRLERSWRGSKAFEREPFHHLQRSMCFPLAAGSVLGYLRPTPLAAHCNYPPHRTDCGRDGSRTHSLMRGGQ